MQVAGVSESLLRLTGDTFNQFKGEYRKLSHADRMQALSTLQMRIAAMYAVQNEDMQRQRRQHAQDRRHREVDSNRRLQQNNTPQPHKRQRSSIVGDLESETDQLQEQLQPDGQLLGPQLMDEAQFHLDHTTVQHVQQVQTEVPLPSMGIPHFQQFTNTSKRGRIQ